MTDMLKPCPFCGSADLEVTADPLDRRDSFVLCRSCGARTSSAFHAEKSVEKWNQRTERTCRMLPSATRDVCTVSHYMMNGNLVDQVFGYRECSECGALVFDCPTVNYCPFCGAKVVQE